MLIVHQFLFSDKGRYIANFSSKISSSYQQQKIGCLNRGLGVVTKWSYSVILLNQTRKFSTRLEVTLLCKIKKICTFSFKALKVLWSNISASSKKWVVQALLRSDQEATEEDKVEVTTTSRLQSKKLKNDLFLRSFIGSS